MIRNLSDIYKFHMLRKNHRLSVSELQNLQERKLNALIQHACKNVPYYKKIFDQSGINPENIHTVDVLSKIPITSRTQMQKLPREEIIAKNVRMSQCEQLWTSGSSGKPLDVFIDKKESCLRKLLLARLFWENGCNINDRILYIIHPRYLPCFAYGKARRLVQYINLMRFKCLSIFDDSGQWLSEAVKFQPTVIKGSVSSIKRLALEMKQKGERSINPRMIFCTSELLSRYDREYLQSVFRAEVFDYYSCIECGVVAWECREHRGYHIQSDNVIMEIIRDGRNVMLDQEEGEVVITGLNSYTMPFIRYKIGDIGALSNEQCTCGRTLPIMKIIAGRSNDCIFTLNGKTVSPYALTCATQGLGIAQFQIIQNHKNEVGINVVKSTGYSTESLRKLRENLKHVLGQDMHIKLSIVERIDQDSTGKFKAIKARIKV